MSRPEFDDLRGWILAHHERPDGSGYPFGLTQSEIPLEASILAVADAFEAMTADRVYRPALGEAGARAELEAGAGIQFDAEVVEAFLRALDRDAASASHGAARRGRLRRRAAAVAIEHRPASTRSRARRLLAPLATATPATAVEWLATIGGPGQFNAPHGVAVDAGGTLYVADTGNNRLWRIGASEAVLPYAPSGPLAVAAGPVGPVVADTGVDRVAAAGRGRLRRSARPGRVRPGSRPTSSGRPG